ncbi:MAG TPA: hypothetical protein PLS29_04595 [Acidimicrobiales bacterium]|nr:hypothetical protein [Acidimicrobiales bacterium]
MGARALRRVAAAGTGALVAGSLLGALASATTPPRAERVGPGATLVTLSGGPGVPARPVGSTRDGATIARVRQLVNALPAFHPAAVCPDDLTVPYVLAFYRTPGTAPFARVGFQLGGCPHATVSHGARVVAPPLGGPRLLATFTLIQTLVEHHPSRT